jgi:cation diffusion facilitator CzcD-associated flavoprotein CzcO
MAPEQGKNFDWGTRMSSVEGKKLDPNTWRDKYREERDKRLRSDGTGQWVEMAGEYARYLDDPYVDSSFTREPVTDEVDVVVVGGGFGGLLTGARLREAGVKSLRMIEKGGDFGGTWYWNRYPGAMCDVESYVYLPLLEEIGYVPKEKYTRAPEILAHSRAIGEHYHLYDGALFQTEVTEMRWEDASSRWIVSTNRGDAIRARFVCMANGPLHRPKLPGIPGLDSFKGHTFHTSRWDYDYTGGDPDGNLTGLRDKRVGVIGTGATAVQCIPHVGEWAEHLYVFQRTPSSIDIRANRPTDPEWAAGLGDGWQKRRMENFTNLVSGVYEAEDMVSDGWTDIIGKMVAMAQTASAESLTPAGLAEMMELADFQKMEEIRARVESLVQDESTAEALKPYYRQFCKRPCFHDEYLDTFNRTSVTLVDTQGRGVERITERGAVVDGVEYELDCIIYATGFEVGTNYSRRAGYEIYGRNGVSLTDKWANGNRTLHGFFVRDFPNCFLIQNSQATLTVNFVHVLDEQATHLGHVLGHAVANDIRLVEASEEGEAQWVEEVIASSKGNPMGEDYQRNCTPGYYNREGEEVDAMLARQNGMYGGGPLAFFNILAKWRAAGDFAGLELTK